ncbi:MAG: hypothetical protein R3F36_08710 [Candidatus Competibacteraceae bacterium]
MHVVDHTSLMAKQLLEQQATANKVVGPEGSSGSAISATLAASGSDSVSQA